MQHETQIHSSSYHNYAPEAAPEHAFSNFAQVESTSWQNEPTEHPKRVHTAEDFANAAFFLDSLVANPMLSPAAAAQRYVETHPNIDAYPLRYNERRQSQKAWRAFYGKKEKDTQRMQKLFACLDRPCRYIITAKDLDLPKEFENSAKFYDRAVNQAWKTAIETLFNTKNRNNVLWFKLEVGESSRTHVHIFANHDAALTHLPRGTTPQHKVRLIETPEAAVSYLLKPALSYSTEHLALWINAKRQHSGKHLPRVSGYRNLPNSRTWGKA